MARGPSLCTRRTACGVSCLPDRAVALPGETVRVRVWVASASGPVADNVTARWSASAGRIDDQTTAPTWLLEDAPVERRQTATVDVDVAARRAGSCSLDVWVVEPAAPRRRAGGDPAATFRLRGEYITRRAFLRSGQVGEPGFGLYSYFLLREPRRCRRAPARRRASWRRFSTSIVGVADQEHYIERRRLNGSYMPVTMDPPHGLTAAERRGVGARTLRLRARHAAAESLSRRSPAAAPSSSPFPRRCDRR